MEWTYKSVIIRVETDGKFYFSINGEVHTEDSLDCAKHKIDDLLEDYYSFSKKDLDKLCKKLDKREEELVRNLINELNIHRYNAYCEIGISDDFLFNIEF